MTPELEPLSAASLAVLEGASVPAPPADVEARVFSRLRAELTAPALPSPPAPTRYGPLGPLGAPVAVASLAVGLILGALLHSGFAEPRVVTEVRTIEVPAPPVAVTAVVPAPPPQAAPRPATPRPAAKDPDPPGRDRALAEERSLIEQARSALVRGEARLATDALSRHAQLFPGGRLAEERESLAVQALMNAGDFAAARARARDFAANFPNSLLAPAVEAAVQSMPP